MRLCSTDIDPDLQSVACPLISPLFVRLAESRLSLSDLPLAR
jgi:hypothetical protein